MFPMGSRGMSYFKIALLSPLILFAAAIVAGVLLNVFYAGWCFVFIFLLNIQSEAIDNFGYWLSAMAGIASTIWLFIRGMRQFTKPASGETASSLDERRNTEGSSSEA
jgi:hypothetical protein